VANVFPEMRISDELRTDRAIVKNIIVDDNHVTQNISFFGLTITCSCFSLYEESYKYQVGHEQSPDKPLDKDVNALDASGIHFFLD
jgi:hypothetical protein